MRAAFERRGVEPGLGQHAGGGAHVLGLAVVRGAGERQLLGAEPEPVGGAAFHQRQRLQQLDRRARKHRPRDVAERDDARAVGVHHGDGAGMRRFDAAAAQDFDQDRIHSLTFFA